MDAFTTDQEFISALSYYLRADESRVTEWTQHQQFAYFIMRLELLDLSRDDRWCNLVKECARRECRITRQEFEELVEEEKQFWAEVERIRSYGPRTICMEDIPWAPDHEMHPIIDGFASKPIAIAPDPQEIIDSIQRSQHTSAALDTLFDFAIQHGIFHSVDPYLYEHIMNIAYPGYVRCSCCRQLISKDEIDDRTVFRSYKDITGLHVIVSCPQCTKRTSDLYHRRLITKDGEFLVLPMIVEHIP